MLSTRSILVIAIALLCTPSLAQTIHPVSDRLDAIVSYPLFVAITADNERDLRNGVTTKLDDGRTMHSEPYWIGLTRAPALPAWTSSTGHWSATHYNEIAKTPLASRPRGTWFIEVPLPIDAVGQGLWIQGERYELNWLPDPHRTNLEADHQQSQNKSNHDLAEFWSLSLADDALADPAVQLAIEQYRSDPFQLWRAKLLVDGLDPHTEQSEFHSHALDALAEELDSDTPGASLLRELARQHEARWQIILGRVWLIDPGVARRLKLQLIRTARFEDRTLPLWPSDTTAIARLAHDLLSHFVDDQTRVLRAKAWLEAQPIAIAWVRDDQGQIEAGTNRFISTLSCVSLPQSPGASLFRIDTPTTRFNADPALTTLSPNLATPISVSMEQIQRSPTNPVPELRSMDVRTSYWNASRTVIVSTTPARSPSIAIGPMLNDWTMNTLLSNTPEIGALPNTAHATMGILRRVAPPTRSDPASGWQLYIECASPNPISTNESLTLWVGPYTNAFAQWRITPNPIDSKPVIDFASGSRLSMGIPKADIRVMNDRWVAMITLPRGAFDEDLILQLGLERTDADGVHTAWPRRMIPDQPEPGRLSIEADNFDQLLTD